MPPNFLSITSYTARQKLQNLGLHGTMKHLRSEPSVHSSLIHLFIYYEYFPLALTWYHLIPLAVIQTTSLSPVHTKPWRFICSLSVFSTNPYLVLFDSLGCYLDNFTEPCPHKTQEIHLFIKCIFR